MNTRAASPWEQSEKIIVKVRFFGRFDSSSERQRERGGAIERRGVEAGLPPVITSGGDSSYARMRLESRRQSGLRVRVERDPMGLS